MLNKGLLMAVGEDLGPVLSIYFTPGNSANATVYVKLSSGGTIAVTGLQTKRKVFRFSEIDVTASILITYYAYLTNIVTKNLGTCHKQTRMPEVDQRVLCIEDVTQSASIVLE